MKKTLILLSSILFSLWGCQDVVDINTPESTPKLVVDALIGYNNNGGDPVSIGQVKLSLSAPYFNDSTPIVDTAEVFFINEESGARYTLEQDEPGVYGTSFPTLEFNTDYSLEILYNNEVYRATEQLVPAAIINNIEQGDGYLIDPDETEITITIEDIAGERNYYLFAFEFEDYLVSDDEFYQDNTLTFSYFYEDISAGDTVTITLLGITKRFSNYVNIVLSQTEASGGLFGSPIGTVRGNFINETNPDNFPLGYFSISEFNLAILEIE